MNRKTPLWDKTSPALTPEPRPPVGQLDRIGAIAEIVNLRRILAAERRTNQRIQKGMGEYLETLQSTLSAVRGLYLAEVAPKPGPLEGKR
jgi:hypothetical protein